MRKLILAVLCLLVPRAVVAGGVCGVSSNGVCANKVLNQKVIVQKTVAAVPAQTFVTFVPSTLVTNGSYSSVNPSQTYGYQYNGQQSSYTGNNTELLLRERIDSLEAKIDALLQSQTGVSATVFSAETILQKRCSRCHGPKPTGGPSLFDASGRMIEPLPRFKIWKSVSHDYDDVSKMPQGKDGDPQKLPVEELQVIRDWVMSGLDDIKY